MIHTDYIKVTFSIPKTIVEDLKHNTDNMSKYVTDAIAERRAYEKRVRAIDTVQKLGPAFPQITDASAYIRELRAENDERTDRLGV